MASRLERHAEVVAGLRIQIGRMGNVPVLDRLDRSRIGFGLDAIDRRLPRSGLPTGVLHEVMGQGPDTEHGATASLLIAGLLARIDPTRPVLWAMQRNDLFAPGLATVGLHPHRLILADCGKSVLAVMEEALRHPDLVAVVGELEGKLDLNASRRLQIAAETSGVTAFLIRRSRRFDDPALLTPSAAVSRWRVAALPQTGTTCAVDSLSGRALWRLELLRCREASFPFNWIVQSCDAQGRLAEVTPDAASRQGGPYTPDRLPLASLLANGPAPARGMLRQA